MVAQRFLVLARREYTEALIYQGMLDAGPGDDPAAAVRARYGGDWLELVLAPETAVHWVVRPEGPAGAGRPRAAGRRQGGP